MARYRDPNTFDVRIHVDNFFWLCMGEDHRRGEGFFVSFGLVPMRRLAPAPQESPRLWSFEWTSGRRASVKPLMSAVGPRWRFRSDWRKVGGALRGWY